MTRDPARPVLISVELLTRLFSYDCAMDRQSTPYLRARYGIDEPGLKRTLKGWIPAALILLLVGGGWLIWSADHFAKPEISPSLISFQVLDSQHISITYYVYVRTATKSHQCTLIASDYQANTVGEITDQIPAGAQSYTRTVIIPTRAPAVAASIDHCQ